MDFWKFYSIANSTYLTHKGEVRYGQHLMNELYQYNPDLYNEITFESEVDPFYNDKKVSAFLEFAEKNWDAHYKG